MQLYEETMHFMGRSKRLNNNNGADVFEQYTDGIMPKKLKKSENHR